MSQNRLHDEWLSLIEVSGPFLAGTVLNEVFPQGLEQVDPLKRKRIRQAYEEWRDALDSNDPEFPELHRAWIDEVLSRGLGLDEEGRSDLLRRRNRLPEHLLVSIPGHGLRLAPDAAVVDVQQADKPLLLIQIYSPETDLEATTDTEGIAASPAERMVMLNRATGCRLGLLTNGERWMLVDAPTDGVTSIASWYARLWVQEPVTLQAFMTLLGVRRFFVDKSVQLPALFDRSMKYQDEVTDALAEQVRRAVEVLIQSLDKADQDRNRELLRDVPPTELYEAGLTVMMRLVFLLSAEERGLLLLGDETYESSYAVSTLRMQLRVESDEILERRWDAWSRLLATFRAVYGGIEHENMRMPALGGSLFDPDRFPFLEGRAKGSNWRHDTAKPLPIDNRTVLLLLEAIQQLQGRTLSYRALDVEQIGYIYEGLLDRTVKRISEVTLELDATKSAKTPWVTLSELESAKRDSVDRLVELLQDRTGSAESRVRNDLAKPIDDTLSDKVLTACHADVALRERVKPYAHLLRIDLWGYPLVYPKNAFIVTTGSERRETGTHYTPKSLTEAVVSETLTPVCFTGPSIGKPREEWELKSAAELLDLKVCDPAMGSGAFLVQVCRWLAERIVEAWAQAEDSGYFVDVDGEVLPELGDKEPLSDDAESRTLIARRLVAERCLYGVDMNPVAVELAKLSIWLVTLSKDRPFGFLDHNLRCGDSLLGINRLDQLTELSIEPGKDCAQMRVFGRNIRQAVNDAIVLRQRLRSIRIRDIHDVESMAGLNTEARHILEVPTRIADAFIGAVMCSEGDRNLLETAIASLAVCAGEAIEGNLQSLENVIRRAVIALSVELAEGKVPRRPFHWPLEFPEVFLRPNGGFDTIVGNPPFLGGNKISGHNGHLYREYLVTQLANSERGSADLIAYFLLRLSRLVRELGALGVIATNSVAEGETRDVGLKQVLSAGAQIFWGVRSEPWHGTANVSTSRIHLYFGDWSGDRHLDGKQVDKISEHLTTRQGWKPAKLNSNLDLCFQGSNILGLGFTMTPEKANEIIAQHPEYECNVLLPFLIGNEITTQPDPTPERWVISFWDWTEEEAKRFPVLYEQVRRLVKPERDDSNDNPNARRRKEKWWLFGENAKNLYHSIGRGHLFVKHPKGTFPSDPMEQVIVFATQASKYPSFTVVPSGYIFAHSLCVISSMSFALLGCLSSDVHGAWAFENGSRLETRLRYAHGNIFETFPFPHGVLEDANEELEEIGHRFFNTRRNYMLATGKGLTKFYNDFHNSSLQTPILQELREIQAELNNKVIDAYGFTEIQPNYGFHEVSYLPESDRIRFTFDEVTRLEILSRLTELNHQRSQAEQAKEQSTEAAGVDKMPRKRANRPKVELSDIHLKLF